MPIKLIVMVKRKPGLSREAFREGYENSHTRIAVRLFGHLWLAYTRNYLKTASNLGAPNPDDGPDEIGFDAVSEFIVRDEAALAEMARISAEHYALIKADEALWFDQPRSWLVTCETVEENLGRAA